MKKLIFFLAMGLAVASCKKDGDDPSDNQAPTNPLPEQYREMRGIFNGNGVGAAADLAPGVVLLFNQDGDRYAWLEDGEIKVERELDDSESIFRDSDMETVGAATRTAAGQISIFNASGEQFASASFNANAVENGSENAHLFSWNGSPENTSAWSSNTTFSQISAMWTLTKPGDDCFDATVVFETVNMANGSGDQLQPYFIPGDFFSDGPFATHLWKAKNNCGGDDGVTPFDRIAAACRYIHGDRTEEVLFSEDGTRFCYYTVSEGIMSEVFELY